MNITIMPLSNKSIYQQKRNNNIEFKAVKSNISKVASTAVAAVAVGGINVSASKSRITGYARKSEAINNICEQINKESTLDKELAASLTRALKCSINPSNIDAKLNLYERYKNDEKFKGNGILELIDVLAYTDSNNLSLAKKLCSGTEGVDYCVSEANNCYSPMSDILSKTTNYNIKLAEALVDLNEVDKTTMSELLDKTTEQSANIKLATLKFLEKDGKLDNEQIYNIISNVNADNILYKLAVYDVFSNELSMYNKEFGDTLAEVDDYNIDSYVPYSILQDLDYDKLYSVKKYRNILQYV